MLRLCSWTVPFQRCCSSVTRLRIDRCRSSCAVVSICGRRRADRSSWQHSQTYGSTYRSNIRVNRRRADRSSWQHSQTYGSTYRSNIRVKHTASRQVLLATQSNIQVKHTGQTYGSNIRVNRRRADRSSWQQGTQSNIRVKHTGQQAASRQVLLATRYTVKHTSQHTGQTYRSTGGEQTGPPGNKVHSQTYKSTYRSNIRVNRRRADRSSWQQGTQSNIQVKHTGFCTQSNIRVKHTSFCTQSNIRVSVHNQTYESKIRVSVHNQTYKFLYTQSLPFKQQKKIFIVKALIIFTTCLFFKVQGKF